MTVGAIFTQRPPRDRPEQPQCVLMKTDRTVMRVVATLLGMCNNLSTVEIVLFPSVNTVSNRTSFSFN